MRNSLLIAALLLVGCGGEEVAVAPEVAPPVAVEASPASPMDKATPNVASRSPGEPEWVGGPGTLTVVYANNIDGEIEPCG